MTIAKHPATVPDECARCRQAFAELERCTAKGVRATAAMVGAALGVSERTARLHLGHLALHRRVEPDGRTPAAGHHVGPAAKVDADATSLEWAGAQDVPDRTCRRLLLTLGAGGWSGQLSQEKLAGTSGVSVRTAERHRPHLDRWVEWSSGRTHDAAGRLVNGPKAWRFVARVQLVPVIRPVRQGGDVHDRAAVDLLEQVPYLSSEDVQDSFLCARVAQALREGMPAPSLLARLSAKPPRTTWYPARLAASRVPESGAVVTVAARVALSMKPRSGSVPAPGRGTAHRCQECRIPLAVPQFDGLCPACRARVSADMADAYAELA